MRGASRIPPGEERLDSAGNSHRLEGTGKEGGEEEEEARTKTALAAQGCFGEGGRVRVVCAVRGHGQRQSLSPSPSAAFHGGFLTAGVGSQRSRRIRPRR